MSDRPIYDCQACGACCIHERSNGPAYVYLEVDEASRLKRLGLKVVQVAGDFFLGARTRADGHRACVAFRGEVGRFCTCSIHDVRPNICRQFDAGDEPCREARARLGLPV